MVLPEEIQIAAMEGLRSSATEGTAPPSVAHRARPRTRESADAHEDAARDLAPLRAVVSERAVLEGDGVLEPPLLSKRICVNAPDPPSQRPCCRYV